MRIHVNVQTRLALIDQWRWELIDGEYAKPLNVLLYILVKDNNLLVEGFDHRKLFGHELYIGDQVRHFYAQRPMVIPKQILMITNPKVKFQQLRFDVKEYIPFENIPIPNPEVPLVQLDRRYERPRPGYTGRDAQSLRGRLF